MEGVERYVDAAALLCRSARSLGVEATIIFLHGETGPPVLNVDNYPGVTDEFRLTHGIGDAVWRINPVFALLRKRLAIVGSEQVHPSMWQELGDRVGYTGPPVFPYALPLVGARGWFGTVVHGNASPLPMELERELTWRATELSVWCTERGIGRVPAFKGAADLPARRYRIAQLAAEGLTNAEIAQTLAISINTVKSRLKQVFAQLCVDNRTELATVLRRLAPLQEVPLGITRLGDVTIARIEHPNGYTAATERRATR